MYYGQPSLGNSKHLVNNDHKIARLSLPCRNYNQCLVLRAPVGFLGSYLRSHVCMRCVFDGTRVFDVFRGKMH